MTTSSRTYDYDLSPELEPDPDAPAVRSRAVPMGMSKPRRDRIITSPIDRRVMDYISPLLWLVLGAAAFGLTAAGTLEGVARLVRLFELSISSLAISGLGVLAVAVLFVGELVTSDRWARVYYTLLVIDVAFSVAFMFDGFAAAARNVGLAGPVALLVGQGLNMMFSTFCAWLPERVLLGLRRKEPAA